MFRLLFLAGYLVGRVDSQSLHQMATSPHDLAKLVASDPEFDVDALLRELGLQDVVHAQCGKSNRCKTEMLLVPNTDQTLLHLIFPNESVLVIRFFSLGNNRWKLSGARFFYQKNDPIRRSLFRFGAKPFLRMSSQGVSGSGASSETEEWFDLSKHVFKPVFSTPVRGHQSRLSLGIDRSFSSDLRWSVSGSLEKIEMVATIRFSIDGLLIGQESRKATYIRNGDESQFHVLNADPSLQLLLDADSGPSDEQLVRHVSPWLRKIARTGHSEGRQKLRRFLSSLKDSQLRSELLELLKNH